MTFMERSFGHKLLDNKKHADQLIEYFTAEFKLKENEDSESVDNQQDMPEVLPSRPQRNSAAPNTLGIIISGWWNYVNYASTAIFEEPKNIKEA